MKELIVSRSVERTLDVLEAMEIRDRGGGGDLEGGDGPLGV